MEKYIQLFQRLGIDRKTATVYLDLLEHGTSHIADITKRTRLHRPEVYRSLPYLSEEKLIAGIKKGKRIYYRALSPDRIVDMIRDFEKKHTHTVDELFFKYEKLEKNIIVTYEEGASGINRVFDDILDTVPKGGVFYRLSAETDVTKSNTYLPKDYRERRDKKGLERIVISSSRAATTKQKRLERDLIVIPREYDEFDQDITMTIYEDKVAFIDFGQENAIIIENPMIAEFQKKIFLLLSRKLSDR